MKIEKIVIHNFRGIVSVEAENLGDTIIIAGQNGSGKSCIFDAIRLLKSTYGGYQQNEWQHFFGEFQIQLTGGATNLKGLFNDETKPCHIECHFRLRDNEKAYINGHAAELLEATIWQSVLPEAFQYGGFHKALFAAQFRERQPEVTQRVVNELPGLLEELAAPSLIGAIEIQPDGRVTIAESRLLAVVFSNYRPRQIGVMDFHGAQRHYGRENVQGINLNLETANQTYSQSSIYNYNNKYNNVKSEMAGNYVKELLAEKAGPVDEGSPQSLTATLKELFEAFFPDKKFLGPRPTIEGSLAFPVLTQSGTEHDLDELSSGEKEILYGYLRIRSSAPRDSIILLDEPELHLNPRLIRGLPEFYRKHLGEALQNQLWLVTHSDALIREAVGKPGFNVFHMLPCGADGAQDSQLRPLVVSGDLDSVLADLVGDLAAYRPGGKGLIFEGGGDSDFDKTLAGTLFSEELRGINLISGTNKARVKLLHEVLERAYQKGDVPTKFYAIVDRDTDGPMAATDAVNRFSWDVYHIENYLLDPEVIAHVVNAIDPRTTKDADSIRKDLESAARLTVPALLVHRIRSLANARLVRSIDLGFSPDTLTVAHDLSGAIGRSMTRMQNEIASGLSESALLAEEQAIRVEIEQSFSDGTWIKNLPGREILREFAKASSLSIGYEVLRNLIVSRMAELGVKPEGMVAVISKIVND
ncbi:AAA family ATPase [Sphingomonas sp. CGMCC 1.13654]|uniref:AAA family ATPase n=1 Tax=Sphingomonas chungangi TaxID=2683589 RepID=A0A838L594_9SPHN|nr:AAA family ATPase [Sphingomonas chungangi]MBA2934334.1 AAA family ATPase [Sphingomonas chungangi]MVW57374.1 AAA family ATPase [Sphingomonas chungangi]